MKTLIILAILHICYLAAGDIDLQNVEIPDLDIDDFAAIKENCEKGGGKGTYDKLKASKDSLQTCLTEFANITAVKNEVEEAKKTGSMDEVFGKYCRKRTKLVSCVDNFTTNLRPCLDSDGKKALNITLDILRQLGDFVCYRDGDRIAMFIAEGGVECLESHTEGIKSCVNSTFKIQPTEVNTNTLPNLLMDKKKCDDLGKLQSCVVHELEKCRDSTPANIVDALFKFIKRSACVNKNKRSVRLQRSAALAASLDDPADFKTSFLNMLREKCVQNVPDGGFEAFTLTFESASHCLKNKTGDGRLFITPVNRYKKYVERCCKKLLEKTEACLPDDEKYWPTFYMEMMQNLIDFVYANKNKLREITGCLQNFKQQSAKADLANCFQVPDSNSLQKEAVCRKMMATKSCLTQQIKNKCIPDITLNKLMEDFFKALTGPCDKKSN